MKEIVERYFAFWNEQNLVGLASLFDESITLRDWEISVSGRDNVVDANKNIFEAVPEIKIEVLDLAVSENKIMAEIKVDLANGDYLEVVDIIELKNDKIKAVKAYKI